MTSLNSKRFLKCLVTYAKTCQKNKDSEAFVKLLASLPISLGKTAKRKANDTKDYTVKRPTKRSKKNADANDDDDDVCDGCDEWFNNKASYTRHQKTCKDDYQPEKRQSESTKYNCILCEKKFVYINRHYKLVHKVYDLEQVLFDDGIMLSLPSMKMACVKAPKLKMRLEKANKRYMDTTCRLCDAEHEDTTLLEEHYIKYHAVHSDSLDLINRLFRAEKGSHLGRTLKRISDKKAKVSDNKKLTNVKEPLQKQDASLIMYKCKCGIATVSYDASVEHSQKHLVSGLPPDTISCRVCNFTFEASSFADHLSSHTGDDSSNVSTLEYDFEKLLTGTWFDMFQDLEESHAKEIIDSSLYRHSRSVKIHSKNSDCNTGVLTYQCGTCQFVVEPANIENHCRNCKFLRNIHILPKGHPCSECNRKFCNPKALATHKENHVTGFRIVTINNKDDWEFNKTLLDLQEHYNSEDSEGEENRIRDTANSDGNPERLCDKCGQWVVVSTFEAHIANWCKGKTSEQENASCSSQIIVDRNQNESATGEQTEQEPQFNDDEKRMQTQDGDIPAENDGNRKEIDAEGTVERWDNDSDSCGTLHHSVCYVHADIHISLTENRKKVAKEISNNDAGSPELSLLEVYGINDKQASVGENTPEMSSTPDLQHILENGDTENEFNQHGQWNAKVVSQDIFSDDITQNENAGLAEGNMTKNEEREENDLEQDAAIKLEKNNRLDNRESNTRKSSRDIIHAMIQDDDDTRF